MCLEYIYHSESIESDSSNITDSLFLCFLPDGQQKAPTITHTYYDQIKFQEECWVFYGQISTNATQACSDSAGGRIRNWYPKLMSLLHNHWIELFKKLQDSFKTASFISSSSITSHGSQALWHGSVLLVLNPDDDEWKVRIQGVPHLSAAPRTSKWDTAQSPQTRSEIYGKLELVLTWACHKAKLERVWLKKAQYLHWVVARTLCKTYGFAERRTGQMPLLPDSADTGFLTIPAVQAYSRDYASKILACFQSSAMWWRLFGHPFYDECVRTEARSPSNPPGGPRFLDITHDIGEFLHSIANKHPERRGG